MTDTFSDHTAIIAGMKTFHVDLSGLDARHPVHYSRRLLIFCCTSSAQRDAQLTAFKSGLQALVSRCPLLGGIVTSLQPDEASEGDSDWRTIVPGPGIELVVKDLRTTIPSFEELEKADFPVLKLPYDLLMPIPQDVGNDRPFAACKMQFSAIEGGTIITWAMSHSVADGSGTNELMHVLAEETRLAQKGGHGPNITVMGLDRSVMRNITSKVSFNIEEHPAYKWKEPTAVNKTPLGQEFTHSFEASSPEIPVLLKIPAAKLVQLKADATTPGAPPISTHDALAALMWRTVLAVRSLRCTVEHYLPLSTMGSIFMPSDGRRHLNLPQPYVGNAVYQLTAALELDRLFSHSGLQQAASTIRSAITAVTPELVSSLMSMTNKRWIDWQFASSASTTGFAMGTDWTSGSLYSDDWGQEFGPLIRYRYPAVLGEAGNYVLPKLPNGEAEIIVSVMPNELDILKGPGGFGKYLES